MKKYLIILPLLLLALYTSASVVPSATLKNYFLTGSRPTQSQFSDLIDSTDFIDNFHSTTTDSLAEGSTNLYFTTARAISALTSTLTNYLTLNGNGSGLTGITKSQVGLNNVDNNKDCCHLN